MKLFELDENTSVQTNHEDGKIERLYQTQHSFDYPALVLEGNLELYHLDILKNILDALESKEDDSTYYYLHIQVEGTYVNIGKLSSKKLYMFLTNKVFDSFDKKLYVKDDIFYDGDMLYAFCEL